MTGCIPVNIPAGKNFTYATNDNVGVISILKKTRQYLAPLNPDGMKKNDYYMSSFFDPTQIDETKLNSKSSISIKLYDNLSDMRAGSSPSGSMTVEGKWGKVIIEVTRPSYLSDSRFSGTYTNINKGKILSQEAVQLFKDIRNMGPAEIFEILKAGGKIDGVDVKDIVFTSLRSDGRVSGEFLSKDTNYLLVSEDLLQRASGKLTWKRDMRIIRKYDGSSDELLAKCIAKGIWTPTSK